MSFTIRFADYPESPDPRRSIFVKALQVVTESDVEVITSKSRLVDLEIVSNFIDTNLATKAKLRFEAHFSNAKWNEYVKTYTRGFRSEYKGLARKRVWYSGENLRPPVSGFDGTISFDATDERLNNLFFPYWMYRLDWGFSSSGFEIEPAVEDLTAPREATDKPQTACTFSSVYEPNREKIVMAVSEIMTVHKFGKSNGNLVSSKLITSKMHGFQICNENDLYPNYVTEKLIEAWMSQNVPIWSGLDTENWFNKAAFVDVTNLTQSEIMDKVKSISKDQIMYMRSQPILNRKPELKPLLDFLAKIVN